MPQLDANTFIYQYIGIITTFIIIYTLLSYIILPILLRLLLIRNSFLLNHQNFNDILQLNSLTNKQLLILKRSNYNNLVLNNIITSTTGFIKNLLNLVNTNLINTVSGNNRYAITTYPTLLEFNLTYLILFLTLEVEDDVTNE